MQQQARHQKQEIVGIQVEGGERASRGKHLSDIDKSQARRSTDRKHRRVFQPFGGLLTRSSSGRSGRPSVTPKDSAVFMELCGRREIGDGDGTKSLICRPWRGFATCR